MSAFVVPRAHVAAIIKWARAARLVGPEPPSGIRAKLTCTRAADILMSENVRSVLARYPDCTPDDMPGTTGEQPAAPFTHAEILAARVLSASEVLHACSCLSYQSCETEDWPRTTACALVECIEATAVQRGGKKGDGSAHDVGCWPIYEKTETANAAMHC